MNGEFCKMYRGFWILLIVVGMCFFASGFFKSENYAIVPSIGGLILIAVAIPFLFLNRGAYFRIEEKMVSARFHLFGKLNCTLDDISFCLPQYNTLNLVLKNGKRHTVMGIENSWELASYIRRRTFALESVSPHELRLELAAVRSARKKELARVIVLIVLMFLFIILAVIITDAKDIPDFDRGDWVFFYIMMGLCILSTVGAFYFAGRCGSHLIPIELLNYRLRGALIAFEPLPAGNVTCVFTDPDYYFRITCYSFPDSSGCYYCVQNIAGGRELVTEYSSEVYDSFEELMDELNSLCLVDISRNFT